MNTEFAACRRSTALSVAAMLNGDDDGGNFAPFHAHSEPHTPFSMPASASPVAPPMPKSSLAADGYTCASQTSAALINATAATDHCSSSIPHTSTLFSFASLVLSATAAPTDPSSPNTPISPSPSDAYSAAAASPTASYAMPPFATNDCRDTVADSASTAATDPSSQGGSRSIATTDIKPVRYDKNGKVIKKRIRKTCHFPCKLCPKVYTRKYNLDAHMNGHANVRPFVCMNEGCSSAFARKNDLVRHRATVHERRVFGVCDGCGYKFYRADSYNRHLKKKAQGRGCVTVDDDDDDDEDDPIDDVKEA